MLVTLIIILYTTLTLLCLVASLALLFWLAGNIFTDAPFVPVPKLVLKSIAGYVDDSKGSTFYDLGCGDGRVVRFVAKTYPSLPCLGYEIALIPYLLSVLQTPKRSYKNVKVLKQDFRTVKLAPGACVFTYLLPGAMKLLKEIIATQGVSGIRIIACNFELAGYTPQAVTKVHCNKRTYNLYIYDL